jgi:hypothetical protein
MVFRSFPYPSQLLHKQRFFNFVLPRIVSGYTQTQGSPRQTVYLVALASIIKIIPRAICVAELDTVRSSRRFFPLLNRTSTRVPCPRVPF